MMQGERLANVGEPLEKRASGLTVRSVVLGALVVAAVTVGSPYALWRIGSSELTWSYLPIAAIFPFFVVVCVVNLVLKLCHPRFALRPQELLVIFIMGLVGTTIPIFLVGFFIALLASPYYYATPENDWAGYIHPHIPTWMAPSDEHHAMKWFFEGLPRHESIPWLAWVVPLGWWLSLILVVYAVCFCIVAILRKQWVEHERLVFPLMAIPREMVADSDDGSRAPAFMRNRMFWIAFLIPVAVIGWNTIHYFMPNFPTLEIQSTFRSLTFARGFPSILLGLNFPALGAAYFVEAKLLFSIWFFYLFSVIQEGLYARVGFGIGGYDPFVWGLPSISWQSSGAFIVMVFWSLWMARGHLKQVARKAFTRHSPIDDSGELISYRTAVLGMLLGLAYILVWLHMAGMDFKVAALFVPMVFIVYLGITRLVIQGGVFYLVPPITAQPFVIQTLGSALIAPKAMTSLAFSFSWHGDVQTAFMPMAAQAARLKEVVGTHRKAIPWAIAIAIPIGFVGAIAYLLTAGYTTGAANFGSWVFRGAGERAFNDIVNLMKSPSGVDLKRMTFLGVGAAVMSALTLMQYRFLWWPLHPMGFAISSVWPVRRIALSVFLAWAIKSTILNIGGVKLYKQVRPLFVGLFLGSCVGIGISFFIDMIWFPGQGHFILNG